MMMSRRNAYREKEAAIGLRAAAMQAGSFALG